MSWAWASRRAPDSSAVVLRSRSASTWTKLHNSFTDSEQLAGELAQRAWYVVEPELADVFTTEPEELWRKVLRRQGGNIAMVSNWTEDPDLN